jgi:ribosomal protein S18 acetylase RimI-like enzyme
MEIRNVRATDLVGVSRLLGELGYPVTDDLVAERLASIGDQRGAVFVAETGEVVVGWVHVCAAASLQYGQFAEVTGLVIAEDHRGAGIGGRLMAEAESWARNEGFPEVRLRSRSSRLRTHGFYRGLGYTEVKEQVMFVKGL